MLNDLFSIFDSEAELHGVQKIKTIGTGNSIPAIDASNRNRIAIGDCYMAVAGLWSNEYDHAEQIIDFAASVLKSTFN